MAVELTTIPKKESTNPLAWTIGRQRRENNLTRATECTRCAFSSPKILTRILYQEEGTRMIDWATMVPIIAQIATPRILDVVSDRFKTTPEEEKQKLARA